MKTKEEVPHENDHRFTYGNTYYVSLRSIMAKNPAASVTDKAQKTSISTIKDLDNDVCT